jgi:hypothetical protein
MKRLQKKRFIGKLRQRSRLPRRLNNDQLAISPRKFIRHGTENGLKKEVVITTHTGRTPLPPRGLNSPFKRG